MASYPRLPQKFGQLALALLLALIPLLAPFAPLTPTTYAQGTCTTNSLLDWDALSWVANGTTTVANGNTYAAQNVMRQTFAPTAPSGRRPVNVDFQFSGATNRFNSTLPDDTTGVTPGGGSQSLEVDYTLANTSESIALLITFDTDVTQVSFTVHDVDRVSDSNDDRVTITGRNNNGDAQVGTITNGANNSLTSSTGNSYVVDGIGTGGATVSTAGNVGVNFGANAIRSITLVFANNPTGASVSAQEMGLNDISFCALSTPVCATTTGELNWWTGALLTIGNAIWTPAGSLNQSYTILGNALGAPVGFNFAMSGNTSHFSAGYPVVSTQFTGGSIISLDNQSLALVVAPPSASSAITLTINLDTPVRDLYFQVFDTDVSNDDTSPNLPNTADNDRRDVVTVVGYNTVNGQTVLPALMGASTTSLQDNITIANTFSGINGGSDSATQGAPNTSSEANMDVRFADPVNRITLRYEEGGGASAPTARGIGLGNIQYCRPPALAVTLNSFEAICRPDDILLAWETASETNALGFNLYRSTDATMTGERLNGELIPSASPGGGQGALYEFPDGKVEAGSTYYYTLESVDTTGASVLHPAVEGAFPCQQQPTALTLSEFSADAMPIFPYAATALLALIGVGWLFKQRKPR